MHILKSGKYMLETGHRNVQGETGSYRKFCITELFSPVEAFFLKINIHLNLSYIPQGM